MSNTVSAVANIVRGLVSLGILGVLGTGGWFAYTAYDAREQLHRELAEQSAQIEALSQRNQQLAEHNQKLTEENEKLNLALRLLKVDHRVAQIEVLDQHDGPERAQTRFRFTEVTTDGSPVGEPKEFTVEGETIYIDAWVIKYADELVEQADPLRSTSVCLFRRVFGEYQEPSEGFALDAFGSRPAVYSQGNEQSAIERDIWANFWQYANSPAKARKSGVRAAHGEAPSIRLQPNKRYRVELRASAGLTIVPEDAQPGPAS
jgi:regulator of replication initiation timing